MSSLLPKGRASSAGPVQHHRSGRRGAGLENGMGALLGGLCGYMLAKLLQQRRVLRSLQEDLSALRRQQGGLEQRLHQLEQRRSVSTGSPPLEEKMSPVGGDEVSQSSGENASAEEGTDPSPIDAPVAAAIQAEENNLPRSGDGPAPPSASNALERGLQALRGYFFGGNTLVRVGVVVTVFGLGLLAKYAAEHSMFPVELRLMTAALLGLGFIGVGWWTRGPRPGFAAALQGGGVAAIYIVVFFALRIYGFISAAAAFPLLILMVAFSNTLAVLQDFKSLAVLALFGGFLAPIVASSGSGNHVALFSYYAVLNAGIVGVAYFKAWRELNLLGFLCTFGISTAWGVTRYQAQHFASTEPFLLLFFLFYVAVAVLFAWRQGPKLRGLVDGGIVFGTPMAAFSLQMALVRDFELGIAFSALGFGFFYVVLAAFLWKRMRETARVLTESFLALGVGLATLAIPFAFDDQHVTASSWAFEGAAGFWIGVRQKRRLACAAGILLQVAAAVAFMVEGTARSGDLVVLNGRFLGAVAIALSALLIARLIEHKDDRQATWERLLAPLMLAWGVGWWLAAGALEIGDSFSSNERMFFFGFVVLSACLLDTIAGALGWRLGRIPPILLLPFAYLVLLGIAVDKAHPSANYGYGLWPVALLSLLWLLRRRERIVWPNWAHVLSHLLFYVLCVTLFTWESVHWTQRFLHGLNAWPLAVAGVLPAFFLRVGMRAQDRDRWPFAAYPRSYGFYGAAAIMLYLLFWFFWGLSSDGEASLIPYLLLLNPLELATALMLIVCFRWRYWARSRFVEAASLNRVFLSLGGGVLLLWVSAMIGRTVHHWVRIPYRGSRLFDSAEFQTSISIVWTLLALASMLLADRRASRPLWMIGAALLGVVIIKLFAVDMEALGTLWRIASFLAVGLLVLVIGYGAPIPPARSSLKGGPPPVTAESES